MKVGITAIPLLPKVGGMKTVVSLLARKVARLALP
jgi:hypothetical protein